MTSRRTQKIRVFIVDDHDVVLRGLQDILAEHPDMAVVGTSQGGPDLIRQVESARPDVVLLDLIVPAMNPIETMKRLLALVPAPEIVIVSAGLDRLVAAKAAEMGVAGYLLKEEALSDSLPRAVRLVDCGGVAFSRRVQDFLDHSRVVQGGVELNPEQYQVLCLMVEAYNTHEIAARMGKSPQAVYSIQQRIREKLKVETCEQAIVRALTERLVDLPAH